jgi:HK97 family phage major capsid protein
MAGHIKSAQTLSAEVKRIYERADLSGRDITPAETAEVEGLLMECKAKKRIEDIGRELGGGFSSIMTGGGSPSGASPGEAFVMSKGYGAIRNADARAQSWSTGVVEVGLSAKGTILEGTGAPGSGTGGGLVPIPQVVPGSVDKLFQPLTLEALLLSGVATGPMIRHIVQGTATSGAAGVGEAGLKPESTIAWSVVDENVKKIATSIVLSDEAIEDAPAVSTLVNTSLSLFIRIESERQLIRGTSGGNEVQGLLTSRSVPVYAGGTAAGNKAVQLFKAMSGMRGSAFVEPEWMVIHPTDWETIRLYTDTAGQFIGGGPLQGQYANAGQVGASGQISGAQDYLWGKPVYLSAAIGAGTALIGNSQSAQVWNRGGLSVEATNSHSSNFTLNLSVIRAERRLALSVYRANGFVEARIS